MPGTDETNRGEKQNKCMSSKVNVLHLSVILMRTEYSLLQKRVKASPLEFIDNLFIKKLKIIKLN